MKQKQLFDRLFTERKDEIRKLNQKINNNDLTYHLKNKESGSKYFSGFNFPLAFKEAWGYGDIK